MASPLLYLVAASDAGCLSAKELDAPLLKQSTTNICKEKTHV